MMIGSNHCVSLSTAYVELLLEEAGDVHQLIGELAGALAHPDHLDHRVGEQVGLRERLGEALAGQHRLGGRLEALLEDQVVGAVDRARHRLGERHAGVEEGGEHPGEPLGGGVHDHGVEDRDLEQEGVQAPATARRADVDHRADDADRPGTPVTRPAVDPTKSATAMSIRVGSGSSASNDLKNSANFGITKITMIATTPKATTSRITG